MPQCCLSVEGVLLGVEAKGFNVELRAGGNGFPGTDPREEAEGGRLAHHCLSFMKIRMLRPWHFRVERQRGSEATGTHL